MGEACGVGVGSAALEQQHRSRRHPLGSVLRGLMRERLDPGRAAAAVWLGITLGIVPIYGFQSVLALVLASLLKLNRPVTLAGTLISNPPLQPFLFLGALQVGHRATRGSWLPVSAAVAYATPLTDHVIALLIGSFILSIVIGGPAAAATYLFVARSASRQSGGSAAGDSPAA